MAMAANEEKPRDDHKVSDEKTTDHQTTVTDISSTISSSISSSSAESLLGPNLNILDKYPEYATTSLLDDLRRTEYGYLDEGQHVYLDYTGSGLASRSQYRSHHNRLDKGAFGNPHSANPTSEASTELVERTRRRVLAHFNADPKEYAAVFTANASGAAKLVAESYPFAKGMRYVLTADNHNSVNGVREFAAKGGTETVYVPTTAPELRVDNGTLLKALKERGRERHGGILSACFPIVANWTDEKSGLFAYPAQSNFSGVKHPLEWVKLAQQRGYDVLLDAAAYLPTNELDLSLVKPEFVIVSWYKLFGYPTGVGCLIARRDAMRRLNRPWFSGGTVHTVTTGAIWHAMAKDEAAFEDGTPNFHSVPDVAVGLDWISGIGLPLIQTRVRCLTAYCLDRLQGLKHSTGQPLIQIYGPRDATSRGGTISFNFLDASGNIVDERLVALESAAGHISLRTGCFCNPGAAEDAFGLDAASLVSTLRSRRRLEIDEVLKLLGMPSGGAIRVSFGIASTVSDVDRFIAFAEGTYKDRTIHLGSEKLLLPRGGC